MARGRCLKGKASTEGFQGAGHSKKKAIAPIVQGFEQISLLLLGLVE
jgi:hypothetical protein